MRVLFLLMFLLGSNLLSQSDRTFKVFFKEGKKLFEQGAYQEALTKFKEAYRLDPAPKKIKSEGTFFEPYLPRHRIALCLEHIDILEADTWITESLTALERNTLKKRQLTASYRQDVERIQALAKQKRRELETAYQLELASAQSLLDGQKFDEAEKAFQKLFEKDPKRPEASAGLNNVVFARKGFIENKYLGIQMAIAQGELAQAGELLARVEKVDPAHPELDAFRSRIDEALREKETKLKQDVIPPPEHTVQVAKTDEPILQKDAAPQFSEFVSSAEKKLVARDALLDSLIPYQHGNPELALNKLEQISFDGIEDWGSYHWLKSIFLLGQYVHGNEQDLSILEKARQSMVRAVDLSGDFEPDPTLYPDYVLELFAEVTSETEH